MQKYFCIPTTHSKTFDRRGGVNIMQNEKESIKIPAVEQWLNKIPEPFVPDEFSEARMEKTRPVWVRQDLMKTVYLQGNQCYFKDSDPEQDSQEKHKKSQEVIPKRVTFKTNEEFSDSKDNSECDKDDPNTKTDFRLMRQKPDEDRLELARCMNRHLIGVYQRKLYERSQPFVYDSQKNKSPWNQTVNKSPKETSPNKDVESLQNFEPTTREESDLQSPLTNENKDRSESARQHRTASRRGSNRVTMTIQKPQIRGLLVDSASNQKPSIVRASKNANIREEFALQQKITGYRKSCSQSINSIKLAQRRLNTSLQRLRGKMAQNKMDENQMIAFRNTPDQVFLRNKGYMPSTRDTRSAHICFPPLRYQRRRVITVS